MWNERRLARRAARGDPDAFAAIFRRYQQDLYRYCVAILGDPQDAQDALQNTMVKALAALPGERRQIELKPWLYRVAHNESIELRRRGRPSEPLADDVPDAAMSLEQRAADRAQLRHLLADIGELPERQRGALVMRELAGLDFEEIGAALDTSPGAARQVLYEARRGLQQMGEGREMKCEAVTALLSEQDGRVARRRDIRAHLRDCPECRRFGEAIHTRSETLAAISPLPAVAAAAIAKGAFSGTTAGGGATAGSAASGGGAATSAVGAAGGAAKAASTAAILKSAAGIVAVVAVGAVAVDHGHLLHGDPDSTGAPHRAVTAGGAPFGAPGSSPFAATADAAGRAVAGAGALPGAQAGDRHANGVEGNKSVARGTTGPSGDPAAAHLAAGITDAGAPGRGGAAQSAPGTSHSAKAHPAHPAHPKHPAHHGHAAHPGRDAHPSHPAHPDHPASSTSHSSTDSSSHPEASATTSTKSERTEHPSHSATTADEQTAAEAPATEQEAEIVAEPEEASGAGEATTAPNSGQAGNEVVP